MKWAGFCHQAAQSSSKIFASKAKLCGTEARLHAAESKLCAAEARLRAVEGRLRAAESKLCAAEARLWAAEGRLRAAKVQLPGFEAQLSEVEGRKRPANALPKSRRSRRLKIAHRFIGGDQHEQQSQSVKRTAELKSKSLQDLLSRPFHGLVFNLTTFPSDKSLGYFHSSAHADSKPTFWAKRTATVQL